MPGSSLQEFPTDSAPEPVPATIVREQLVRVVNSPDFVSSVRLTRLNSPGIGCVLPVVNMSPEPEQDYFCDGITEEIC